MHQSFPHLRRNHRLSWRCLGRCRAGKSLFFWVHHWWGKGRTWGNLVHSLLGWNLQTSHCRGQSSSRHVGSTSYLVLQKRLLAFNCWTCFASYESYFSRDAAYSVYFQRHRRCFLFALLLLLRSVEYSSTFLKILSLKSSYISRTVRSTHFDLLDGLVDL